MRAGASSHSQNHAGRAFGNTVSTAMSRPPYVARKQGTNGQSLSHKASPPSGRGTHTGRPAPCCVELPMAGHAHALVVVNVLVVAGEVRPLVPASGICPAPRATLWGTALGVDPEVQSLVPGRIASPHAVALPGLIALSGGSALGQVPLEDGLNSVALRRNRTDLRDRHAGLVHLDDLGDNFGRVLSWLASASFTSHSAPRSRRTWSRFSQPLLVW